MSRASDLANVIASGSTNIVAEGTATTNLQQGLAKAWANYKGTSTESVRDSINVSSVTDNTTGDFTVNYSNSFDNANYVVGGLASIQPANSGWSDLNIRDNNAVPTTSATRIGNIGYTTFQDSNYALPIAHGDLA